MSEPPGNISSTHLMSLWWLAWAGGGGTRAPLMTQGAPGAPGAGRDVGLMYSLSSQSEDGLSPLDTGGRDLRAGTEMD